jgi:hypothetical protein
MPQFATSGDWASVASICCRMPGVRESSGRRILHPAALLPTGVHCGCQVRRNRVSMAAPRVKGPGATICVTGRTRAAGSRVPAQAEAGACGAPKPICPNPPGQEKAIGSTRLSWAGGSTGIRLRRTPIVRCRHLAVLPTWTRWAVFEGGSVDEAKRSPVPIESPPELNRSSPASPFGDI